MKELIAYMARNLVAESGRVDVREVQGDQADVYELAVAPSDKGQVIGKQGRTIRALRALVNAAAVRQGKRAVLDVVD